VTSIVKNEEMRRHRPRWSGWGRPVTGRRRAAAVRARRSAPPGCRSGPTPSVWGRH